MTLRSDRDLLTAEEVASYLDVRPVTIYRWCREGRLPCFKVGKSWRIRRAALDEFLRQRERGTSLVGQLRAFLTIPDQIIAITETTDDMHRIDAAFFQVGEVREGLLAKFDAGESLPTVREGLICHGLDVPRLEREDRLRFFAEPAPLARAATLRPQVAAPARAGRPLWVAFNWAEQVDLDAALAQQEELAALAGQSQVVILTQVLAGTADAWPAAARRRLRALHRSLIELSADGLTLSRRTQV